MNDELISILGTIGFLTLANFALVIANVLTLKSIERERREISETYNCNRAWIACYDKKERGF